MRDVNEVMGQKNNLHDNGTQIVAEMTVVVGDSGQRSK